MIEDIRYLYIYIYIIMMDYSRVNAVCQSHSCENTLEINILPCLYRHSHFAIGLLTLAKATFNEQTKRIKHGIEKREENLTRWIFPRFLVSSLSSWNM